MDNNKHPFGGISITAQTIEKAASCAVLNCYGVTSVAPLPAKNVLEELFVHEEKLGVVALKKSDGWHVSLYIEVAYGLKLTEIISSVQKQVKYELEKMFDLKLKTVNIYIVGVKALI